MKNNKGIIYLFLSLILTISMFVFSGCGADTVPETTSAASSNLPTSSTAQATVPASSALSQQELSQLLSNSVKAYGNLDTYRFEVAQSLDP